MTGGGYRVLWMQNPKLALVVVSQNQKPIVMWIISFSDRRSSLSFLNY